MTDARIIVVHWVCGDGCCSDTYYSVEYGWEEYTVSSLTKGVELCEEKGWSYTIEDIYPEDV